MRSGSAATARCRAAGPGHHLRPRQRAARRRLCALAGVLLATVVAFGGTAAAVPEPMLRMSPYGNDAALLAGARYAPSTPVTISATLAGADGHATDAGGGQVTTDSAGNFMVIVVLPDAAGRLTVTVTALGASEESTSLDVTPPAASARDRLWPLADDDAPPPGPPGAVMRGGTTELTDTAAYPNTPIVPGPVAIPPGGVPVPAGADIQSYIDRYPAGTQFDLAAGTYSGPGVLLPKAGDSFYGVRAGTGGTLLSGLGIHRPNGAATGVGIHNISITGYSDSGRNAAIDSNLHESDAASGWVITNSEIYGNYLGASLGSNALVENNTFHDNSCKGAAGGMTGTVWRYNQFLHNDLPGVSDPYGDCAGAKVTVETGNQFIGNLFSGNGHPAGLWMDVSCHGNTFIDNISYNNDGSGFTDETGYGNTFTNNIAAGNGRNTRDPWRRTGLVLESTARDTVTGTVAWANNGPGITVYSEDRRDAAGTARNSGNTVRDNTLDAGPALIKINIEAPQSIGPNAVTSPAGMAVPRLAAGPQM